jgi:hypothetical protein
MPAERLPAPDRVRCPAVHERAEPHLRTRRIVYIKPGTHLDRPAALQ